MCIAYLALGLHENWPLLIAANRDEFHERPTRAAAPWPDHPDVIAGLDLKGGGTWLGVTRQGRFGLLTNYRDRQLKAAAPSRGELVSQYLIGDMSASEYVSALCDQAPSYNGFNLIVGDLQQAWYASNRTPALRPQALAGRSHVVSNHLLDTPWPKVERLRQALDDMDADVLSETINPVFSALRDTVTAPDDSLPRTGLSLERERLLSSPFIISPDYGTRCSTVIAVHRSGQAFLSEISHDPAGQPVQRHDWPFRIANPVFRL